MVYDLEEMIILIIYNVKLIYRYSVRKHAVDGRTKAGEKCPSLLRTLSEEQYKGLRRF